MANRNYSMKRDASTNRCFMMKDLPTTNIRTTSSRCLKKCPASGDCDQADGHHPQKRRRSRVTPLHRRPGANTHIFSGRSAQRGLLCREPLLPCVCVARLAVADQPVQMHSDVGGFGGSMRKRDGTIERHAGFLVAAQLH